MRVSFRQILFILAALVGIVLAGVSLSDESSEVQAPPLREAVASVNPSAGTGSGSIEVFFGIDDDTHLDKTPPRLELGLDLKRMGWTYDCMECHRHVEEPTNFQREIKVEHENIVLEHGNNRYCLNCHHDTNRNAFVDYDGAEIPEAQVTQLCAKCHGPKYRDWNAGVHGRQNGYWDASKGPKTKLRCIQCHDPHQPAFAPMKPMAPLVYPKRAPQPDPHGGDHH